MNDKKVIKIAVIVIAICVVLLTTIFVGEKIIQHHQYLKRKEATRRLFELDQNYIDKNKGPCTSIFCDNNTENKKKK